MKHLTSQFRSNSVEESDRILPSQDDLNKQTHFESERVEKTNPILNATLCQADNCAARGLIDAVLTRAYDPGPCGKSFEGDECSRTNPIHSTRG